jgi:methyl-accepting chemotaxis protein
MSYLLNDLSIKVKLVSISLFLLLLMLFCLGYALNSFNQVGEELDSIANRDIPMASIVTVITKHQLEQLRYFERTMRYGILHQQNTGASAEYSNGRAQFDHSDSQIIEELKTAKAMSLEGSQFAKTELERAEFVRIAEALAVIEQDYLSFKQHALRVFSLLNKGELQEAERLAESMEQEEKKLASECESLLREIEQITKEATHRAAEHERLAFKVLSALALFSLVAGISISWILSNNIAVRICKTVKVLKTTASGDLRYDLEVSGKDEIGELEKAIVAMQGNLKKMISHITDTTIQLSTSADEVSVVTTQTSENIQQQQLETEQITTAMTQMNATVHEVTRNIENTSSAATEANHKAEQGQSMVKMAVEGVHTLGEHIEYNANVISQVEKNSEDINTVLEVIKTIAEQTNLLALNAAIEAARAGEQGRGFAVVADEVRTLAGRTQKSTTDINQMIDNLQTNAMSAVTAMEESRQQVKSVVEMAENADSALSAISKSVAEIDQMSTQIATAAEEQSTVTEEMSRNIDHINDMASQNAAGSQQTSTAGMELSHMASSLKQLVGEFRV